MQSCNIVSEVHFSISENTNDIILSVSHSPLSYVMYDAVTNSREVLTTKANQYQNIQEHSYLFVQKIMYILV